MEDLTGKQFGPYQIVAPLGEGGMAAVYKAYQPAMERYVALKVLPRHFAEDPQFVARFQREAKLLAQLQHPHILPVFDYGQAGGYAYLVMPFVQSGTLTDWLKGQPLSLPRIRHVITQVGDALHYAHSRGLVHRDVKPSNVLIDESGNCLLTDFGLARMVEASVKLTTSGTILGTPAYMSPEQGSGQTSDARSDLYSLGVILYEMATGRVPYEAETPIAVVFKHIHDPLPPASSVNPELPNSVERVILKALSKGPEDRYQTAGDMVRAIQAAIPETLPVSAELAAPTPAAVIAAASTLEPQRVETQATKLAEKSRPILPAWAWGIVGVAALLLVIFRSLFVAFDKGTNPASQTATQTAEVIAVVPTVATMSIPSSQLAETPLPTETPPPPPTATIDPDPLVYDNFNNPANDGSFNLSQWLPHWQFGDISQKEGVLIITAKGDTQEESELIAIKYADFSLTDPIFFQADLLLSSESNTDGHVSIGIRNNDFSWVSNCIIDYRLSQAMPTNEYCGDTVLPQREGHTYGIARPVRLNEWHSLRIEVDPGTMTFTYFLDKVRLGDHIPVDADMLQNTVFTLFVSAYQAKSGTLIGQVDNVRVGPINK